MLLQSSLIFIVFAAAIIFGGIASTANAVNVKSEFIDKFECPEIDDLPDDDDDNINIELIQSVCHKLYRLRNCQIATAVSF